MAAVKFCGLTRPEDAGAARALGADFVGVIFAGGPRALAPERAREVLGASSDGGPRRVGVFGADEPSRIAAVAEAVGLDVVQLHGDPTPRDVAGVRDRFGGAVWAVLRVDGTRLDPATLAGLLGAADGVVLDAKVAGRLGGTGVALEWDALREAVAAGRGAARGGGRLVLAGGLTPENVRRAVADLAPDVVDVSSGVERAPGVKDHERMRAFFDAARNS